MTKDVTRQNECYYKHHSRDEERIQIIGKILDIVIIIVAYTERNESTRIISARKASKIERGKYYDHQK
ncbi:MAG TPA: BrnT family toxin [Neisseriales bacterium]|nr:BrnT family toxin [Neisseriales bacterium]